MLTVSLNIETIDAIIAWIDSQPAPLPWHLIDALHTMQEGYDNEAERQYSARYDWDRTAEND